MLRKTLIGVAAAALLAPLASAQTADQLVAKNLEAKGGLQRIRSMKTMRMTGKMVMGQGMEAPVTWMAKRPKRMRTEFTLQGATNVQAYDGTNGWVTMPFAGMGPQAVTQEQGKLLEEQADIDGPLMDYKQKGNEVELVGEEQVAGADAYKLKVTNKNGDVTYIYLDAGTYLVIKSEAKRSIHGVEFENETVLGDYKEVGGMMFPHSIETGMKGSPLKRKMLVEKVEVNPDLPDSLFALPAGVKTAGMAANSARAMATADSAKAAAAKGTAAAAKKATKKAAATKPKKP